MKSIRLLPFASASGPANMAADEMMLRTAAEHGIASIRAYTWEQPTLTLGYFEPAADRLVEASTAGLAWVRRATGGAAIVHDPATEITYSLALPANAEWHSKDENWICRMHHIIRKSLIEFGIKAKLVVCGEEKLLGPALCFRHHAAGDLLVNGSKVAGSAQRKQKGAILQHGSILLSTSRHAPSLPGLTELTAGATAVSNSDEKAIPAQKLMSMMLTQFAQDAGCHIHHESWRAEETGPHYQDALAKFLSREWNEKR